MKEELSKEDYAVITAGVEKIQADEQLRNAREIEDFEFICRNLAYLDVETILQIVDRSHLDMMNRPESAVRQHVVGLSSRGQETLRDMIATTKYQILIVHNDHSEYARKYPDFFKASVSDKCQAYFSRGKDASE